MCLSYADHRRDEKEAASESASSAEAYAAATTTRGGASLVASSAVVALSSGTKRRRPQPDEAEEDAEWSPDGEEGECIEGGTELNVVAELTAVPVPAVGSWRRAPRRSTTAGRGGKKV